MLRPPHLEQVLRAVVRQAGFRSVHLYDEYATAQESASVTPTAPARVSERHNGLVLDLALCERWIRRAHRGCDCTEEELGEIDRMAPEVAERTAHRSRRVLEAIRQPAGGRRAPMTALVAADRRCRHKLAGSPPVQQPGCEYATNRPSEVGLPADACVPWEEAPDHPAVHQQDEHRNDDLCGAA